MGLCSHYARRDDPQVSAILHRTRLQVCRRAPRFDDNRDMKGDTEHKTTILLLCAKHALRECKNVRMIPGLAKRVRELELELEFIKRNTIGSDTNNQA